MCACKYLHTEPWTLVPCKELHYTVCTVDPFTTHRGPFSLYVAFKGEDVERNRGMSVR